MTRAQMKRAAMALMAQAVDNAGVGKSAKDWGVPSLEVCAWSPRCQWMICEDGPFPGYAAASITEASMLYSEAHR